MDEETESDAEMEIDVPLNEDLNTDARALNAWRDGIAQQMWTSYLQRTRDEWSDTDHKNFDYCCSHITNLTIKIEFAQSLVLLWNVYLIVSTLHLLFKAKARNQIEKRI